MTTFGLSPAGFSPAHFAIAGTPRDAVADKPALIGDGSAMQRLRMQIERIGPYFRTVLIRGEIGTGKELAGRALHARGDRSEGPFVVCHAARLEDGQEGRENNLIESMAEAAQDGTLFLDGVEEMAPEAQRRLLRMLDQKTGLRIIASTTQDLRVLAAAGIFRQDVYHRLAMIEITLEPVRRRVEDIPALAMYFLERFRSRYEKPVAGIAQEAMERLLLHQWPGNVRELENVLHNGVLQCEDAVLGTADLSSLMGMSTASLPAEVLRPSEPQMRLQDVIDRHVVRVLQECSGNKVRAAEMLGISRSTLYRMLEGCSAEAAGRQI
jgi:DNA-binding NtrC family response regulator